MNPELNQDQKAGLEHIIQVYSEKLKDPNIFKTLLEDVRVETFTVDSIELADILFGIFITLCHVYNSLPNEKRGEYYEVGERIVSSLFKSQMKSRSFLRELVNRANNVCSTFSLIINKNMLNNQLEFQKTYKTIFYNTDTNIQPKKPFITVLIIAHGTDTLNSLSNSDDNNTLMYNLSSVPYVGAISVSDEEVDTILRQLKPILHTKPNRFVDIVDNLTELKETYISNVKNIPKFNRHAELAIQYSDYACRVTKPIKDKLFSFTSILYPGIYVIAGVDLDINLKQEQRLFNLLIPEDLMDFNELFGKDQNYGVDIFHSRFDINYEDFGVPSTILGFNNEPITLSGINSYFNGLGIKNVGYIDFSCRGDMDMCEDVRHKQMVVEDIPVKCPSNLFGGSRRRRKNNNKNKKYKYKKQNRTIKINK